MTTTRRRIAQAAVLVAGLYCTRRYYRNWGATKGECEMRLPGDDVVSEPAVQATEAAYIDATPAAVWSWLVQTGRNRRLDAASATAGDQAGAADRGRDAQDPLGVGDVIALIPEGRWGSASGVTMTVVELVPERYAVLTAVQPELRWRAVLSVHLQPHWDDRVRLLVRVRFALRYPGEALTIEMARPIMAFATRGLLLGVKHRAERAAVAEPATPVTG